MTNEIITSNTIKYLRFPMTIGIILAHGNLARLGIMVHGVKYGTNLPDWLIYTISLFSEVLASICVPTFFVISGYLFFYRSDFDGHIYIQKLKKRFRTLMIPYLLWNLIALLAVLVKMLPIFSSFFQNINDIEIRFSLIRLFNTFFYGDGTNGILVYPYLAAPSVSPLPINGPMWYVRDLMVIILLTPLVYWLVKKLKIWYVIGLGLYLYVIGNRFLPEGSYLSIVLDYLFFFSIGAYLSINKQNMVTQMRKLKYVTILFIPAAIFNVLSITTPYNRYIFFPFIVIGIITFIVVVSYLLEKNKIHVNETLANCSFFIFAFHSLILMEIGKILFIGLHLNDTPLTILFLYIAIPTISVCIGLIVYLFLKRFAPKLFSLLNGGR